MNVKVNVQLARLNYRAVKSKCKVIDQMQDISESKVKKAKQVAKKVNNRAKTDDAGRRRVILKMRIFICPSL